MSDQDKPKFFFLSHNEAPGVRTAIINRHTALHLHAKRRRNQDAARTYFKSLTDADDDDEVQDRGLEPNKVLPKKTQAFQHRWRVVQPNTADRKQRTGRKCKIQTICEDEDISRSSRSSSCSLPEVRPSSWSTELYQDFTIDSSKFRVFQYFLHYWMPSAKSLSRACQITAFTPVWPGDRELSRNLLEQAFHSQNPVSLYSLLSVGARRMQIVNGVSAGISAPEVYTAKALTSLREMIASQTQPPVRLTLDLAYLILAEVYVKSSSKPETYGHLLRDIIIMHGGLHKLPSFIAQACLAYDNLMSVSTLSPPALDSYKRPELLLDPFTMASLNEDEIMVEVFHTIQALEERPRIMATVSHTYSRIMEALQDLPYYAQERVRTEVEAYRFHVVGLMTAPLVAVSDASQSSNEDAIVAAADGQYAHIKSHILLTWLWNTALCCLQSAPERREAAQLVPCCDIEISLMIKQVTRIIDRLQGTSWNLQPSILIWLLAVAALSTSPGSERDYILDLLRSTILNEALLGCHDLDRLLHQNPPLTILLDSAGESSLWEFVMWQSPNASTCSQLKVSDPTYGIE